MQNQFLEKFKPKKIWSRTKYEEFDHCGPLPPINLFLLHRRQKFSFQLLRLADVSELRNVCPTGHTRRKYAQVASPECLSMLGLKFHEF